MKTKERDFYIDELEVALNKIGNVNCCCTHSVELTEKTWAAMRLIDEIIELLENGSK